MSASAQPEPEAPFEERAPVQEAATKAASSWLHHFARTLKTCRLYDGNNPTVIRFREDLGSALRRTLNEGGPLTYTFSSEDVFADGESLYPARSRDDNLALPFYRDGIRSITLHPGVEQRELDALLDAVLEVTGQHQGENDLVTLLWESNIEHIDVDYIPGEGEMGQGVSADDADVVPWPVAGVGVEEAEEAEAPAAEGEAADGSGAAPNAGRSDDWSVGELTVEIEAGFAELEALAPSEVARFHEEYLAEHRVPITTATLAVARALLSANPTMEDKREISAFLPRVLRASVSSANWLEAREAVALLKICGLGFWNIEMFTQELLQPISVSGTVERVDQQEAQQVEDMIAFARELGDPAVDWLNMVLAESQNRRNRRLMAEAIADLCRTNPERLGPYLSDPRWYVVRNVVHILGWIGGNQIVGLLDTALRHSDVRVRHEAIAALGQVDTRLARPLLLRMVDGADTRTFCAVLHQLSGSKDTPTARLLLAYLQDPAFDERPEEEKRAIYSALSGAGGDEVLPELEAELHRTSWFSRAHEVHRAAVARCIARIDTSLARMIIERGAQSRRAPVRKACEDARGGALVDE